jgi:hypothetical protein
MMRGLDEVTDISRKKVLNAETSVGDGAILKYDRIIRTQ